MPLPVCFAAILAIAYMMILPSVAILGELRHINPKNERLTFDGFVRKAWAVPRASIIIAGFGVYLGVCLTAAAVVSYLMTTELMVQLIPSFHPFI